MAIQILCVLELPIKSICAVLFCLQSSERHRWDSGLGKALVKMNKIRSEQERKCAKYTRTTEVEGLVLTKMLPLFKKIIFILSNYDSVAEAEFKIISSKSFCLTHCTDHCYW